MSVEVDGVNIIVAGEDAAPLVPRHIEGSLTDEKKKQIISGEILFSQVDRRYVFSTHHGGHADQKIVPITGEKKIVEITGDYTVGEWDDIIIVDAGSNSVDITLLPVADALKRPLTVIGYDVTNPVTINTQNSEHIRSVDTDTNTSETVTSGEKVKIISTGVYYQLLT